MQNTLLAGLRALTPRMAGTNLRERSIACLGALIGIGLAGAISGWAAGAEHWPLLVAPLGASAVLLFAVPASPLAQPWSIIGGNTISALVGITIAHLVPDKAIAAAMAVAAAIAVMSLLRCLHPPGGAASLLGVAPDDLPEAVREAADGARAADGYAAVADAVFVDIAAPA